MLIRESSKRASRNAIGANPANPLATSGRFCRQIRPERSRSASVSPGQRSRRRTTPAENHSEVQTHGEIGAHFLQNHPEVAECVLAGKVEREERAQAEEERAFAIGSKSRRRVSVHNRTGGKRSSGQNASTRCALPHEQGEQGTEVCSFRTRLRPLFTKRRPHWHLRNYPDRLSGRVPILSNIRCLCNARQSPAHQPCT